MKSLLLIFLTSFAANLSAVEIKPGEVVGRHIFGLARDYNGLPVLKNERSMIYPKVDFAEEVIAHNKHFMFSVFKQKIGSVYLSQLDKTASKAIDTVSLDLSSVNGLSDPKLVAKTDWNSVLLSETTSVDAASHEAFKKEFEGYFSNKGSLVKPYFYGWVAELIMLNDSLDAKIIKDYAIGRLHADQVLPMPDQKTLYLLDSQYAGRLYLFIADTEGSYAKGKLYVIGEKAGKIKAILLGRGSALKMKFKLKKASFKDFFESKSTMTGKCDKGFSFISTFYGDECLKIKSKNKKYAGLFEPVRVSAVKKAPLFSEKLESMEFLPQSQQIKLNQRIFSLVENNKLKTNFFLKVKI